MAPTRLIRIKDRDGGILAEGRSGSIKAFVQDLVAQGVSLARADLAGQDLSQTDLDSADFTDALLDGADLRGASARKATFAGASMKGVAAQGLHAERAIFEGADLSRGDEGKGAKFDGARLAFANLRSAKLDGADFENAGLSSSLFTHAKGKGCSFRRAFLHNADFSFAKLVRPDFREARLTSTLRLAPEHLPDRTFGATVVGGEYDDALFDGTTPALRNDRRWTSALDTVAWAASTSVLLYAGMQLPEHAEAHLLHHVVDNGAALVAVTGIAHLLKEKFSETIRDKLEEGIVFAQTAVRRFAEEAVRHGVNIANLVAATAKGRGLAAIRGALASTQSKADRAGFWTRFRSVAIGAEAVVMCDRRHLAMALAALSTLRSRHHKIDQDLVIVRSGEGRDEPSVLRFHAGGGMTAVWLESGRVCAVRTYGEDGNESGSERRGGLVPMAVDVIDSFASGALRENGIADLTWDADTHDVLAGEDGAILVLRRSDRRLDNPEGPAFVGPDGERRRFRNGGRTDGPDYEPDRKDRGLDSGSGAFGFA